MQVIGFNAETEWEEAQCVLVGFGAITKYHRLGG